MKKIGVICLLLCILFNTLTVFASASSLDAERGSISDSNACNGVDAGASLLGSGEIVENAVSIFMYDTETDTLVYEWNSDAKVPPSSLVKIMTAHLVLENGNLEDIVTVEESVLSTLPAGVASVFLQPGEKISLKDLLYCMMVGSGNDAAAVMADHISGSQEAFVQQMNTAAQAMGCTATHFVNVHGLHSDDQYTTARDVGRILREAMQNETFRTIFSTVHYSVAATNKSALRELSSGNFLMNTDSMEIYYDARVTGGRTGIANDGTTSLAISAEGNGLKLITILTGAVSEIASDGYTVEVFGGYSEMKTLLDHALNSYKVVQVLYEGQSLHQMNVIGGSNDVFLGPSRGVSAIIPSNKKLDDITFKMHTLQELKAPIEQGQRLSYVEIWCNNLCVAQAELFAINSVHAIGSDVNGRGDRSNGVWKVVLQTLIWLLVIAAAGIVVFFSVPRIRGIILNRRNRKYRRSRRRNQ